MRGPRTRQELATVLRDARHRSGLSLRALAKQVGLSASTLQGWFDGKHLPTLALQGEFLELLELLSLTEEMPEDNWLLVLGQLRGLGQVGDNPYVGMQSYTTEDADRFFGRQGSLDELVAAIWAIQTADAPKLVAVVGVSGSGKSSLLQAGLLGGACVTGRLSEFTCEMVQPEDIASWEPPETGPVLLIVDHLERLGSLTHEESEAAVATMGALPPHVTCVFGLAAYAFELVAGDERLRRALAAPVLLGALTRDEFADIIREPARASGRPVDDALTGLILRDLWRYGQPPPSVLPMLSNTLRQSWAHATGPTVTVDDYLAAGGLWASLENLAEGIYTAASPDGQLRIRQLFLDLVQVSSDGIERRDVEVGSLSDESLEVAERFLDVRLLTLEGNLLRVSHSALLGHWQRLSAWVDEEREQLLFRRRISKAAEVWEESNRDPHALIPVEALVFDEFARSTDIALTPVEADFFEASVARAEEESATQRHEIGRLRRRNVIISVLALLAVAGLILSSAMVRRAEYFRASADEARADAQSRQLALIAEEIRATERNVAAQLSLAAYRTSPTLEAQAAVLKSAGLQAPTRVLGVPGTVRLAASPDGELLLRSSADGTVEGWRGPVDEQPAFTFRATDGQLFGVAHGNHGNREIVAAVGQSTASLWDVTDQPTRLGEFGTGAVGYEAVIAGGRAYLGMDDGTIKRVDLDSLDELTPLDTGTGDPVEGMSVSPDGSLVVGTAVERLLMWDADGRSLAGFTVDRRITRSQFSPDGRTLAIGGAGGMVQVLDVSADGSVTTRAANDFGAVRIHSMAFDGHRLFVGAWDGRVGAFSVDGASLGSFYEASTVTGLALLGGRVATGTIDGALRIWPHRYSGVLVEGSATSMPTALVGDHIIKYFDGYAGVYHVDGSPEHRLEFTEDAGTGEGPALVSGHVMSLPTASGRLASWTGDGANSGLPVFSQVGEGRAYGLFGGPGSLAVWAEVSKSSVTVIRRTGLIWQVVTEVPTWSTLAMGWHPSRPWLAAMSIDSERLLIHDLSTGTPQVRGEVEVPTHGAAIQLAWSPEGDRVYLGTDGGLIFVVDVTESGGLTLADETAHVSAGVASIAVADDGDEVAAGLLDGRIHLWDVREREFTPKALLRPGRGAVSEIQLMGEQVVFATDTEGVYGWPLDLATAIEELCGAVGEPLTPEEWRSLAPGVEPLQGCPG